MKKHSGLVGSDMFTSSDTEWHFHLSSALIGRSVSTFIFRARLTHTHTHTHTHTNACLPLALIMTAISAASQLFASESWVLIQSPAENTSCSFTATRTRLNLLYTITLFNEYSVIICSPACSWKLILQSLVTQKLLYIIRGLAIYYTHHFYGVFTTSIIDRRVNYRYFCLQKKNWTDGRTDTIQTQRFARLRKVDFQTKQCLCEAALDSDTIRAGICFFLLLLLLLHHVIAANTLNNNYDNNK